MSQGPFASADLEPGLCFQPSNSRARDSERAGDVRQCLASLDPRHGFTLLVTIQSGVPPHVNSACLRAHAPLTGADLDQLALELGQASQNGKHEPAARRGGVGPGICETTESSARFAHSVEHIQKIARRPR